MNKLATVNVTVPQNASGRGGGERKGKERRGEERKWVEGRGKRGGEMKDRGGWEGNETSGRYRGYRDVHPTDLKIAQTISYPMA